MASNSRSFPSSSASGEKKVGGLLSSLPSPSNNNTALVLAAAGMLTVGVGVGLYYKKKAEEAEAQLKALTAGKGTPLRHDSSLPPPMVSPHLLPPAGAKSKGRPVRVYMDGVFDLMHYGHSNALRQARAVGDVLVVGLVNDAEVVRNKGTPPVMPEEERYAALSACKWVGEVIRDAPYDLTEEWVTKLVTDHQIDYIVHGDDPCITADGKDAYAYAKRIGKYKQIKRTEGVSTTDIVGRMLLMSKEHHLPGPSGEESGPSAGMTGAAVRERTGSLRSSSLGSFGNLADAEGEGADGDGATVAKAQRSATPPPPLPTVHSKFLPTARRIMQFADGRVPKADDRVVYMSGSWDLFSVGQIAALQEARKYGDFLLVGVHDDATVNRHRKHGLPILNLYERTLSLLSCKYVDEVIIGAPWVISEEMIKTMNISVVVRGTVCDSLNYEAHEHLGWQLDVSKVQASIDEAYAVPKSLGILKSFNSPSNLTALDIVNRILDARSTFKARYEKKSKMEQTYVQNKSYVQEG